MKTNHYSLLLNLLSLLTVFVLVHKITLHSQFYQYNTHKYYFFSQNYFDNQN